MKGGSRGEGWVVTQALLGLAIALAPPDATLARLGWLRLPGWLLMVAGAGVGLTASRGLGRNLTAFPRPRAGGELVTSGLYGVVRHPIYLGVMLGAAGWALYRRSMWGLLLTAALLLFFDLKTRREEQWLREQYPGYLAYQQRVKKLIPWLY